ncbi:oligosaccharide flippase family protein [Streptococcus parasuis]|uniref:oligosaccharide flippase family protein n=1 Tax=Streptococcus parasuis TaxID=1501662 RepID=UPI0028A8E5E1|nr:oligosaccharide flippase family protein [Streptococcus parasuis]
MESIRKNLIYNIIYQILIIILPLITAPYISRVLGPTALGIYSYTYSIANYFLLVAMLGISTYGNRQIASTRDNTRKMSKTFFEIYSVQFTTFSIVIIIFLSYIVFFAKDNKIILFIQVLYILSGLLDISWLFFGLEKFKVTVSRNLILKLLTVFAVFIFVNNPEDLWKYALIMSAGTLISQSYLWFYIKGIVKFEKVYMVDILGHIKPILILFIPVISYSIYKVMDKIMLGSLTSYDQVGYYQNSEKIISIPMGVITALGTVMLPRMSNIVSKGDKSKEKSYISLSIKLVTIIGVAIGFGIIGTSDILAIVFFGKDYSASGSIMSLLSLTILSISWANVMRTQYLIPNNFDRVYVSSSMLGAVINFIVNITLIPVFQANGAAIGTIFAETSVMLVQLIFCNKYIPISKYIFQTIPFIVNGLIMMVVVNLVGNYLGISLFTLIVQIIIGGLLYVSLTVFYLYIVKDDLLYLLLKQVKL